MKKTTIAFAIALLIGMAATRSSYAQTDSTFKPSGALNMQFFADYFYKMHGSVLSGNGQYSGVKQDFAAFDIRRVYLGYNYNLSPDFMAEFTLAFEGNYDAQSNRTVYVKIANLQWKNIYPNATLIFGAQATPSFALLSEAVWGYRSVEKTLLDKNGIAGSNDLGLGIRAAFDNDKNYGYDVLYADGTGAKVESDRYKKLYADVWAKFMDKKIIVNVYGDLERKSEVPQDNSTLKFFAAYNTDPITVGVEGFMQTKGSAVYDSASKAYKDIKPVGVGVFVRGQIIEKKLNFFARFDTFNPDNNNSDAGINQNFIVAGLDWTPGPNIHIMPNLWYQGYSNKLASATGTSKSDNDIVPRVTAFFKF